MQGTNKSYTVNNTPLYSQRALQIFQGDQIKGEQTVEIRKDAFQKSDDLSAVADNNKKLSSLARKLQSSALNQEDNTPPIETKEQDKNISASSANKPASASPDKKVNFFFYMDAEYGDIGGSIAKALNRLAEAGSDENMNIVAQLGTLFSYKAPDGKSVTVARHYINHSDYSDFKEEIDRYKLLEEKIPNNPLLNYEMSMLYQDNKDWENAKKYFDKAKSLGILEYLDDDYSEKSREISTELDEARNSLPENNELRGIFKTQPTEILSKKDRMANSMTLEDFLANSLEKYHAEYNVVVIMGHGKAWYSSAEIAPNLIAKAFENAVNKANEKTGRQDKINVLVYDSCFKSSFESLSEGRDILDITIAS
jgi:hypothetical protein